MLSFPRRFWQALNATPTDMPGWAKVGIFFGLPFVFLPLIIFYWVEVYHPGFYAAAYMVSLFAFYVANVRLEKSIKGEMHLRDLKGNFSFIIVAVSGIGAFIGCLPTTTVYGATGLCVALLASYWVPLKRALVILGL